MKERLPDMTSHRMLLDVGVSQKKWIKMQQTYNLIGHSLVINNLINFGSPHNLLGAHQACIARLPPRLQGALWQGVRGPLKAPISPGLG